MGIIDKAEETVTSTTPHVIEALGKIKFFLVGIPIICVIIGIVSQQVLPERNVATATFKMGSFATPDQPEPEALASESQMKARLRANAARLRDEYDGALLLTVLLENEVVTPTATGLGEELTSRFLEEVIQIEIDFQNGRYERLLSAQNRRRAALETQLEETRSRTGRLSILQQQETEPISKLALQQELDNARARQAEIRKEIDTMELLTTSDLFVDTTQFIREPFVIASSNWYRPVVYGAAGLGVGLVLVLLLAVAAIVRALTRKKPAAGATPE